MNRARKQPAALHSTSGWDPDRPEAPDRHHENPSIRPMESGLNCNSIYTRSLGDNNKLKVTWDGPLWTDCSLFLQATLSTFFFNIADDL